MKKKKFNDRPFAYHEEIELEITTLTNLGLGLGRVPLPANLQPAAGNLELETSNLNPSPASAGGPARRSLGEGGWVVMVPFTLPGERVRARVFRNHANYSEADLVAVLSPSIERVAPRCPLFGRCGGCQYQHLAYAGQLAWKRRQVAELLRHMAGIEAPVAPVIPSPREYGYRSKITPHFAAPGAAKCRETAEPFPIGFLRQGMRFDIIDVPHCPIATDAINEKLSEVRSEVHARAAAGEFKRGATLLLREAGGVVATNHDAIVTEAIHFPGAVDATSAGGVLDSGNAKPRTPNPEPRAMRLRFLARDFFQNNPFLLPAFTAYVSAQAASGGARFLIDAYCGSGLFALAAAPAFAEVVGIEISESSVAFARENAAANGVANASFQVGDAAAIFSGLAFLPAGTVVVIDPPRKGCDPSFLDQLLAFGPSTVVYVSCDPATQMRDLRSFLGAGYAVTAVQPFDLFPQTRHLECVLTLRR